MKQTVSDQREYEEYEDMFKNITDISLSKNIAPFSPAIDKVIDSVRTSHKDECDHLKHGIIGPFTRTIVAELPIKVHTREGKEIDLQCKIRSRTMQNLINDDIIENIRSTGSLDLLDIDFEFIVGVAGFSEYHFAQENFYMEIKNHILQFIKQNPQIEKVIVDNYCDGVSATSGYMKAKEPLINQWEKTTRDLFEAFGMPKSFVLQKHSRSVSDGIVLGTYGGKWEELLTPKQKKKFTQLLEIGKELKGFDAAYETKRYIEDIKKIIEDIQEIVSDIENGKQDISLDSKFFFLDNGDNLYDDVIEKGAYNKYYREELDIIQENKKKIAPYLRRKYIGLGCGNGKKDYSIISENIDIDMTRKEPSSGGKISKVILIDSSMKSLSKAEKLISKSGGEWGYSLGLTTIVFSQEWIDSLLENNEIKTLTSVTYNPKELITNIPDIRESSNMFTLFGGTFGNFENYQKLFLQQMDALMNTGDILCISVFNPPKSKEEQEEIVRRYDTPQNAIFIKNFFIKLGIPEDTIEIQVGYDDERDTVHIDAKIHRKDNQPMVIHPTGKDVTVADGTVFHCIASQRMDETDLQKDIKQSQTSLKIIDRISTPDNPFTLYMISK